MQANASITPRQRQFITLLFQGSSIVDAAKACKINESTAHRWLKLPGIQAEQKRLEDVAYEAEEQEITRILTTGYAAVHNRVKALDAMAREVEQSFCHPDTGKIYYQWMSPERLREWRGMLDDIAKELGHRIKKQEITGKDGGPIQVRNPDLKHLTDEELDLLQTLAEQAQERRERGSTA